MPAKQTSLPTKNTPPPAMENFYTPPLNAGEPLGTSASLDDIEALAVTNPDQALKLLNLQNLMEAARTLQKRREQDANFRVSMLQSTEAKMRRDARTQAQCESRGHVREDGSPAIGGQRDSANIFHGVCCKCHKIWDAGIGDGPRQLPPYFANRLNGELIGG